MKHYDKGSLQKALNSQIKEFFKHFTPSQAEDILFEVFNDANLENLAKEVLAEREVLHTKLRKILRTIDQHKEQFKEIQDGTD